MRVAALRCLFLSSLAFAACDGGGADSSPSRPATETSADSAPAARCTLHAIAAPPAATAGTFVALTGGPDGARVFGQLGWWDGRTSGAHALTAESSVAWTGAEYLVATDRSLWTYDPAFAVHRLIHTYPNNICDLRVTESPGGAIVTMRRLARPGDGCVQGEGTLVMQRVSAGHPEPDAPVEPKVEEPANSLSATHARFDTGRLVVTLLHADAEESFLVLTAEGHTLAEVSGPGGDVVCPRPGCLRIPSHEEPALAATDPSAGDVGNLRALLLSRPQGIDLPVRADHIATLAAHGDRVLLFYSSPTEPVTTSSGAIYDFWRRQLVTVLDQYTHNISTVFELQVPASELHVEQTDAGFAIATSAAGSEPTLRLIDCDP